MGRLVDTLQPEAFAEAMRDVSARVFDRARLTTHAATFSTARFDAAFRQVVSDTLAQAEC
jgi:hypothetical protein